MQDVLPLPSLAGRLRPQGAVLLLQLLSLSKTLAPAGVLRKHDRAAGVADGPVNGGTKAHAVIQNAGCCGSCGGNGMYHRGTFRRYLVEGHTQGRKWVSIEEMTTIRLRRDIHTKHEKQHLVSAGTRPTRSAKARKRHVRANFVKAVNKSTNNAYTNQHGTKLAATRLRTRQHYGVVI